MVQPYPQGDVRAMRINWTHLLKVLLAALSALLELLGDCPDKPDPEPGLNQDRRNRQPTNIPPRVQSKQEDDNHTARS